MRMKESERAVHADEEAASRRVVDAAVRKVAAVEEIIHVECPRHVRREPICDMEV